MCINDVLDDDVIYYILDRTFTAKEWHNINLVCHRWNIICNALRDKKAKQFSKFDVTHKIIKVAFKTLSFGTIWCDRSISTSYFYLPSKQLHGEHTTINRLIRRNNQKIVKEQRNVKRYKYGTFVNETQSEYFGEECGEEY